MYEITFKGKRETIVVDDFKGKSLQDYLDTKPDELFVRVNASMVSISSIKSIEKVKEPFAQKEFKKSEVVQLMNTLKKDYVQKKFDGILISRIDQYLIAQGTVRFDNGLCLVLDPASTVRIRSLYEEVRKMEYGIEKALEASAS